MRLRQSPPGRATSPDPGLDPPAQQAAAPPQGLLARWRGGPRLLHGPPLALPGGLDRLAERWARLPPRVRAAVVAGLVLAVAAALSAYLQSVERRWGGEPVTVYVAGRDLAVGALPTGLEAVEVPPPLAPPTAVREPPGEQRLALAAPAGTVLTTTHLDAQGPSTGLDAGERAVPVPIEEGWGVAAGGWVDVWVLDADRGPAARVASARPVLEVRSEAQRVTALVGLRSEDVGPVTAGLAAGRVLLTHAPPPR